MKENEKIIGTKLRKKIQVNLSLMTICIKIQDSPQTLKGFKNKQLLLLFYNEHIFYDFQYYSSRIKTIILI